MNNPDHFWSAGPDLDQLRIQVFAADDPEALPRRLGQLPDDDSGEATKELHRLYSLLADEAERHALSEHRDPR